VLRRVAVVHLWTFSVVDADDVVAADADLDDAIRNLFSAAESFDRDNLGAGTVATLFPRGGFSSIIDLPLAQEPDSADALATKEESLGAAHALAPHAAKLKAQSSKLRQRQSAPPSLRRKPPSAPREPPQPKKKTPREHSVAPMAATISSPAAPSVAP